MFNELRTEPEYTGALKNISADSIAYINRITRCAYHSVYPAKYSDQPELTLFSSTPSSNDLEGIDFDLHDPEGYLNIIVSALIRPNRPFSAELLKKFLTNLVLLSCYWRLMLPHSWDSDYTNPDLSDRVRNPNAYERVLALGAFLEFLLHEKIAVIDKEFGSQYMDGLLSWGCDLRGSNDLYFSVRALCEENDSQPEDARSFSSGEQCKALFIRLKTEIELLRTNQALAFQSAAAGLKDPKAAMSPASGDKFELPQTTTPFSLQYNAMLLGSRKAADQETSVNQDASPVKKRKP